MSWSMFLVLPGVRVRIEWEGEARLQATTASTAATLRLEGILETLVPSAPDSWGPPDRGRHPELAPPPQAETAAPVRGAETC
jgi:hypothetical protein